MAEKMVGLTAVKMAGERAETSARSMDVQRAVPKDSAALIVGDSHCQRY